MAEADSAQIDVRKLRELIAADAALEMIDVREPWERDICRIADSRAIPLGELQRRCGELTTEKPLVMICHHGMRSFHATIWLRENGFENAVNLTGGIDAWAREIEPAMARY